MAETLLKNQIITWLKGFEYWLQYAGNRFLEGEDISEGLVNATYQLFKEDHGLKNVEVERPQIGFNEIIANKAEDIKQLKLHKIKEIENVNALAKGQEISINDNLTIIYGGNGTGKSGYVRLLNNAFSSRGDKSMLHNVFNIAAKSEPTCKFTFQSNEGIYDLLYPFQKRSPEFSQYSVFDSHSVSVHLQEDNKLNFTPSGFEFFNKILELYESLKSKLFQEIAANKPVNDFERHFLNDNEIGTTVRRLNALSNIEELKVLGSYSPEDALKLETLIVKKAELRALDIPKKIEEIQRLHLQLLEFIGRQVAILDCLKTDEIEKYKSLINTFAKFQELAKQEGIKSLEGFEIKDLGSNEWKTFIKAAQSYAAVIEINRNDYPLDKDNCLFCLQPLSEKENSLINSYWGLLKSEAEGELNRTIQTIKEFEKKLKGLLTIKFDETTKLFEYVNNINPELALKWKEIISLSEAGKQNIILNLGNRNLDLPMNEIIFSTDELNDISKKLKSTIEDLFQKNPAKELEAMEKEIRFLRDKNLLNKLLEQILGFVESHKWASIAESTVGVFNPRAITIKQGQLFNLHITDKYTDTFNNECARLDAPKVVNITQRNERISTLRKLHIGGYVANKVLSEGEQRAISLSDFITEAQLNPHNKGVFFDDPVTSQDHYRREKIAERLVELSTEKQVIIFTHDISFLIRLKNKAEECGLTPSYTTIRNAGGTPGIINSNLPWIAQNVKARIGTLRDRLVRLKKVEKEGSDEDYLLEIKSWYSSLREGWERAVEERLFKGVVERFSIGVQTQKLKKVVVTEEFLAAIEKGMTESSKWLHDAATALNPSPPDTNKAEADLNYFDEFATKCVAA
jgi:hypothetical protein